MQHDHVLKKRYFDLLTPSVGGRGRLQAKYLSVISQIKDRKHIEKNFHSVAGIMLNGWGLGVPGWGVGSKSLAWGFAMAPHRMCILVINYPHVFYKIKGIL